MVAVMSVDKDGDATDATEKLTVALIADRHGRFGGLRVGRGVHGIESGEISSNAVDLEVRADEDVGMESLMFDADCVRCSKDNGTETLASAGVLSLYIEDGTERRSSRSRLRQTTMRSRPRSRRRAAKRA